MRHRFAALALVIAAAPACTAEPGVSLQMRSMMAKSTEGVVMQDGAVLGDAGMADWICVIDTVTGAVVGDQDLGDGADKLLDAHGATALAESNGLLYTLDSTTLAPTPSLPVAAISGRVLDDGVTALYQQNGCGVAFSTSAGDVAWGLDGVTCDTGVGFAANRSRGDAWVADGKSLATVSAAGVVRTFPEVNADLVDWDSANNTAVIAAHGDDLVRAVDADGLISWGVQVSGNVHDVAVAGAAGLVVVSIARDNGGEIAILDGATGDQLVSYLTPEVPNIEISSDGRSIALTTDTAVYFYDFDPASNPMDTPTTAQVTDVNGVGAGTLIGVPIATAATAAMIFD